MQLLPAMTQDPSPVMSIDRIRGCQCAQTSRADEEIRLLFQGHNFREIEKMPTAHDAVIRSKLWAGEETDAMRAKIFENIC